MDASEQLLYDYLDEWFALLRTRVQDHYVDLRWTTNVDAAFVARTNRVATGPDRTAWLAMVDRLSR
jgi:hypothetical protein